MRAPDCIVLDFETKPIRQRPHYPPEPVGFALRWPAQSPAYWAWGHPVANNCDKQQAMLALSAAWESGLPILCHYAKFDIAVAHERLGAPMPSWDRIHDTMFLAYLCDPHARSLGLKELAEDLLQWPPAEQDELHDWIWQHREQLVATYGGKVTKTNMGEWIWATPGGLCGKYAIGDIMRTQGLFEHLWPIVQDNGMGAAYDRERQLMPILMENERIGLRVDTARLEQDVSYYDKVMSYTEEWLRRELCASGLNFDADQDVASVLLQRNIVPAGNWQYTKPTKAHPTGQLAVNKESLRPEHFTGNNGAQIASALGYRNRLKTCLEMFMRPWLEQGSERRGYISTTWNQVKGSEGGGTRTGRPSTSNPNLLNISKDFESKRDDGYVHPEFLGVMHLPLVRVYVLPDAGEVFVHRDFDGQEMRVFAHFEQGDLWRQFNDLPELDPHEFIGTEIQRVAGREIERTRVKTLNFQGLYGGGIPALQKKVRCSAAEAKELKAFHDRALPGRVILNEEIKRVVRAGDPIRTWGGRLYFPEAPGHSKKHGRYMTYEYKLINYLVQGSAADLTKQAIIDWNNARGHARFLVTVYDEINLSVPAEHLEREMALLRSVMETPRLTVPMRSSGKEGPSWGELKKCA